MWFFCTVLSSLLLFLSSSWLVLVLARRALESDLSVGAGDEDAVYTYTHTQSVVAATKRRALSSPVNVPDERTPLSTD